MTNAELIAAIKAEVMHKKRCMAELAKQTDANMTSKSCAIFQYAEGLFDNFLSFLESLEKEQSPKIKGWVARDSDATLHFFSSECGDGEPIYDGDSGTWGNATSEMIELPHQTSPFGHLNYWDDPIEVELEIHRV